MLHMNVQTGTRRGRRLPQAGARIDVRIAVDPGPRTSREVIRRTVRVALERVVSKIISPRRTVAVDVLITGEAEIRRLNDAHRHINRATDSLSFPQFEAREVRFLWAVPPPKCYLGKAGRKKSGDEDGPPALETPGRVPVHLGDIVLNLPMLERQAARRDVTLQEELEFVVVHGLLHLLGCDHNTPARRRAMWDYTHLLLYNGRKP